MTQAWPVVRLHQPIGSSACRSQPPPPSALNQTAATHFTFPTNQRKMFPNVYNPPAAAVSLPIKAGKKPQPAPICLPSNHLAASVHSYSANSTYAADSLPSFRHI